MDRPRDLVELEDRWLLPYRGMQVIQICVSYQLTLLLDSGAQVDVETEAELSTLRALDRVKARLLPEQQDVAPALTLFGATVLSAVAFKSGSLRLGFDNGLQLKVKPDVRYEAWSAHGPDDGPRLVCQPGGGIAVWQ
ncbi:DUF6188 family protein [Nonomuraea bangladeshensis]|uniref:DUF6188 family protein n=1 Tax=Nonomuraea bangladeshensis TaxID=404385 RepID=UPI0031D7BE9F